MVCTVYVVACCVEERGGFMTGGADRMGLSARGRPGFAKLLSYFAKELLGIEALEFSTIFHTKI